MFLRQLYRPVAKAFIAEGGNLVIGDVEANKIDTSQRAAVVPIIDSALTAINNAYAAAHDGKGLWNPKLLSSKKFLAGSSFHFFNRTGISDEIFAQRKKTVGDIDTMVDKTKNDEVRQWLSSVAPGTAFGPARYVGMDDKDPAQVLTLWSFPDIVIENNDGKQFPINIQIDLEMKDYEGDEPSDWSKFSTSSSWEDLDSGIKGVFHKFLIQSLTTLTRKEFLLRKLVGRGKARTLQDVPTTDHMYSFAIKSKEGGGLRAKYDPVIDPETGDQEVVNGLPVFTARETTGYEKNVGKIFQSIFGDKLDPKDIDDMREQFNSFIGVAGVMKSVMSPEEQGQTVNSFLEKIYGPGAQGLYANDKEKDAQEKGAAVSKLFDILEMSPPSNLEKMKQTYYDAYKLRESLCESDDYDERDAVIRNSLSWPEVVNKVNSAMKATGWKGRRKDDNSYMFSTKGALDDEWYIVVIENRGNNMFTYALGTVEEGDPHIGEQDSLPMTEASVSELMIAIREGFGLGDPEEIKEADEKDEVVQSKRKGIVHLEKMRDLDFLDLLDELRDEITGKITLDNVPMTVKIDGFGSRFGKAEDGRSFYETSRAGPKFGPGNFLKYHQEKGTQDTEILRRASLFDELQNKIMTLINVIDKRLGKDFLKDIKVHVEVLYLPFATEQEDGKLKFVGIAYDRLPENVELALVPLFAEISSTGAQHPKSTQIVQKLRSLGIVGDTMFIDNSLTQQGSIDVTGMIPPMENLDTLKNMILSNKRDAKKEASTALQPIKDALSKFVIEHPDLLGKDILGKDYEGIILNTSKGPVKITSAEQKDIIATKNAAIKAARPPELDPEKPKSGKTAVVTIGSFIGHVGHQQLVQFVLDKAQELGADPYVYISSMTGPDDPIPPEVKLETWHKLYPEQRDIFSLIQPGGTPVKKIEKELVTVSNPPPYDKVIVMVGEDRYEGMRKWMQHLSKRMKNPQYPGFEHVDFEVENTPRSEESGGTGMSFTQLRNVLKSTDKTAPEQFAEWRKAFDPALDDKWIKFLITVARKGMGIQAKKDIKEGVMSEIDSQIGDKLDKAIALYKKKRINDEVLGDFTIKLARNVSRNLTLNQDDVQQVINDYVDNALEELDEEAAGVGIVTKQNSTADVGPGTLGKMLRSLKLA
jgi:hypothetical protein